MKNVSSGTTPLVDRTDWALVRALTDADIAHDEDSPATKVSDREGAMLKQGGVTVGRARTSFRATGTGWRTRTRRMA